MPCYHFWDLNAMFSPHIFAFHLQSSKNDITFSRVPTSGSKMVLLRQVFSTRGSDTFVSMMSLMAFMYECYHHIIFIMRSDHLNQGLGCFEGRVAVASPLGQRIAIELPQACERDGQEKD